MFVLYIIYIYIYNSNERNTHNHKAQQIWFSQKKNPANLMPHPTVTLLFLIQVFNYYIFIRLHMIVTVTQSKNLKRKFIVFFV